MSFTRKIFVFLPFGCLVLALALWAHNFAVFAQTPSGTAEVSIEIRTPVPNFSLSSPTAGSLEVRWDWDAISPSFVPLGVAQVDVELSTDGLNYGNLQSHPPGDFLASYVGLAAADYTARVTVVDGNDFQYLLGPVTVAGSGRSAWRRHLLPPESELELEEDADTERTDVTISGLAYPGPSTTVTLGNGVDFQASVTPDATGVFSYQTDQLSVGVESFSFVAQDPLGNSSDTILASYTIPADEPFVINDVFLPPTIGVSSPIAALGENVLISGYTYQYAQVSVSINGPSSILLDATADVRGVWSVDFNSSSFSEGTYNIFAQSVSADGSVTSPVSLSVAVELMELVSAAPVCGDGVPELPEECDDGNRFDGDGCSSACLSEVGLPQTVVQQPDESVFETETIDLSYSVLQEPNGAIERVTVYYSRDGGPFEEYQADFSDGVIQLSGLPDGDYELYSLAEDAAGFLEQAPAVPDAVFTIDLFEDFEVLAYPEKRVPAEGNWSLPVKLDLYLSEETMPSYTFDFVTQDDGTFRVDLPDGITLGVYHAVLKGSSHLSKRLENINFSSLRGLLLDFTLGGKFFLLAGDVHQSKDDFIDALDVSALMTLLYEENEEADLNKDGFINALDLSIPVSNLYLRGDGI